MTESRAASEGAYEAAYQAEVRGEYTAAIAKYDAVLKDVRQLDKWPGVAYRKVECLVNLGRFKDAAEDCEKLAQKYPNDSLASEALWRAITLRAGPLNDRKSAIRVAQVLHRVAPRGEYGERAAFSSAVLSYWDGDLKTAKAMLRAYIQEYREGKYLTSAGGLLKRIEGKQ